MSSRQFSRASDLVSGVIDQIRLPGVSSLLQRDGIRWTRDEVSVKESHPVNMRQDRNISARLNFHQLFFERAKIYQMRLPIIANR